MERNKLVVRDGDHAEACTVEESINGRYARVQGDTISGWVEVPDNPAEVGGRLVCHECGRENEDEMGNPAGDFIKDVTVSSKATAETLARIHRIKSGHEARIEDAAA